MEEFEKLKIRDNIKNEWCKVNDIKLLRLNYSQKWNEIENIVTEFIIENEPKPVIRIGINTRCFRCYC